MRIGINAILGSSELRGVGTHIKGLLGAFRTTAPEHQFVVFIPEWLDGVFPSGVNIEYVTLSVPQGRMRRNIWQLAHFFEIAKGYDLDVIHVPDTSPVRRTDVPLVVTIHDLAEFQHGTKYGLLQRYARRVIVKTEVRSADAVLTVSQASKQKIHEVLEVPYEKVSVVHNGVQVVIPTEGELQRVKRKYELSQDYILFVGEIERTKNVDCLLKAYSLLSAPTRESLKVVLAGKAGNAGDEVLELIRKIGSDVRLLGYVPNEDLSALYAQSSLFVFPSFMEGFGIPVLEAMALGVPVLSARATSLPEVCGQAALFFDPHAPEELAEKIEEMYSRPSLQAEMITRGYERAAAFTWEAAAHSTMQVFYSVLRKQIQ